MAEFYLASFVGGPLDGKTGIIDRAAGFGYHLDDSTHRYRKRDAWSREYEQAYDYIGSTTDEEDIALLSKVLHCLMDGDDDAS